MTDVVERDILLMRRIGRHIDGFVDAYCGPPELTEQFTTTDLLPA